MLGSLDFFPPLFPLGRTRGDPKRIGGHHATTGRRPVAGLRPHARRAGRAGPGRGDE